MVVHPADSIETYLDDPIVPLALIAGQGGVMKYWYHLEEPNPKLSRMGLDFLSAPGKCGIKTGHMSLQNILIFLTHSCLNRC